MVRIFGLVLFKSLLQTGIKPFCTNILYYFNCLEHKNFRSNEKWRREEKLHDKGNKYSTLGKRHMN